VVQARGSGEWSNGWVARDTASLAALRIRRAGSGAQEGMMSPGPISGQVTDVVAAACTPLMSLSYRPGEGPGYLPAPPQDSLHFAASTFLQPSELFA
jgi:hypothetical protein